MATATLKIEIEMADLLSAVYSNLMADTSSWVKSLDFDWQNNDGTEKVKVKFLDPDNYPKVKTKTVTPQMLLKAFEACLGKTIWGQVVTPDFMFDCLVSDYILQMALFGKEVYA